MRVIIAGSRGIKGPTDLIERAIAASAYYVTEIVSGGASGVDTLGEEYALRNKIALVRFPVPPSEWKASRAAGLDRNRRMAKYAHALIALWDGRSPGTRHMIETARSTPPIGVHSSDSRGGHMRSPHIDKYRFDQPENIRDAQGRMKMLLLDIRNIEKQLGDPVRYARDGSEMSPSEYRSWYSRIRSSLVYKQTEYGELKDWVRDRRREVYAGHFAITDPNDPRQLLLMTRALLRDLMDKQDDESAEEIGKVYTAIEQHLLHAA